MTETTVQDDDTGAQSARAHGMPDWVDCATTDLAAAEAFYSVVFGWTSEHMTGADGSVYSMQRLNGKKVAGIYPLNQEMQAMKVPPHWGTYFEVDDVDKALKAVKEAGGTVLEEPFDEPNVGRMAIVRDNVGAYLRLWTSVPGMSAEVFNVPGALTWNELNTKQPEKAAPFYKAVFGHETEVSDGPPPYTVLMLGKRPVAGILQTTPEMGEMPPTWDVYFFSDDVDETVAKTKKAGGTVHRQPFDLPGMNARMAVLQDPLGAVFEVIRMEPEQG